MIPNMPYKKMEKVNKFGFIAKCDCGHVHRFKGNEINLSKSNGTTVIFNDIYKCPKCGQSYDGIFENIKNRKYNIFGITLSVILAFGLLFGGYYILNAMFSPAPTTDLNHATNQQYNDFLKWDHKQQQQKYDNQPAFGDK